MQSLQRPSKNVTSSCFLLYPTPPCAPWEAKFSKMSRSHQQEHFIFMNSLMIQSHFAHDGPPQKPRQTTVFTTTFDILSISFHQKKKKTDSPKQSYPKQTDVKWKIEHPWLSLTMLYTADAKVQWCTKWLAASRWKISSQTLSNSCA